FAAVNKLGSDHLDGHLVLTERHDDTRTFYRIDNLGDRFFIHHFRLRTSRDITARLIGYMKLAYAVGRREHVRNRQAP
ncbi:MAG TPA: hypothetical protein VI758_02125, partial [Bacteroidota bacterium]